MVVLGVIGTCCTDTLLLPVEILLPAYFGVLIVEYLSIHLRINGPNF
jgi:hypothetical protein